MLSIVYLSAAVLLFVIGAYIKFKKVTWLISGYNTASKEEKEKYDIDKLCYYMSNFIFSLATIWLVMSIFTLALPNQLGAITLMGVAIETVAIVVGIIFLNTNDRVKK